MNQFTNTEGRSIIVCLLREANINEDMLQLYTGNIAKVIELMDNVATEIIVV